MWQGADHGRDGARQLRTVAKSAKGCGVAKWKEDGVNPVFPCGQVPSHL